MEQQTPLHILARSARQRGELSRAIFELGYHAEVYAGFDELLARPPAEGIVLILEEGEDFSVASLLLAMNGRGTWLPVVALRSDPSPDAVVTAIRAGALDFLALPFSQERFGGMVSNVMREVELNGQVWRRTVEAQGRIAALSQREREVLEWLSEGSSNKVIARQLEISPRTVEIHRANMMLKLGARHSAQAIRMQVEAGFASGPPAPKDRLPA
jgi:FixJ family two-component response regulator